MKYLIIQREYTIVLTHDNLSGRGVLTNQLNGINHLIMESDIITTTPLLNVEYTDLKAYFPKFVEYPALEELEYIDQLILTKCNYLYSVYLLE